MCLLRDNENQIRQKQISDDEFQLLMAEFSQYNLLKDSVRAKLTHQSSRPDLEKIKKDVREEMETEFPAKKKSDHRVLELTFRSSKIYLHIKR